MRLSIKHKLPIIIFLAFILTGGGLIVYYRFFLLENAKSNFKGFQNSIAEVGESISTGIGKHYGDRESIQRFIDDVSKKEDIKITVYEMDGRIAFEADNRSNTEIFGLKRQDNIMVEGEASYFVEIEQPFTIRWLMGIDYGGNLLIIAVSLLFIMVLLLTIYFHYSIVKPLMLLQKSFENVNYRNNEVLPMPERKDEIGDLFRKFEEMVFKLGASYRQQNEMISSISHDLKTPLTSIMGYVERLSHANIKSEEKKQEYYRIIYKKAQDIERLTEEFSDFSKNELDCFALKKEVVSVKKFFESVCNEYSEELQGFDVCLEYSSSKMDDAVSFEIDAAKIRRVFANLIGNSLKYSKNEVKISVSCHVEKESVVFKVRDNGEGVPALELENIFNKFYRIDKSRSPEKGGTGLGLAICKSIIESHNGWIEANNREEGGLEISFGVPLKGTQ